MHFRDNIVRINETGKRMKRIKRWFAASVILLLIATFPAAALADVKNEIKGSANSSSSYNGSGRPSVQDIIATGDDRTIVLPGSGSYFSSYQTMYINAPKGHSVKAYRKPANEGNLQPYAYHGVRVTLLAEEKGFSCVLYHSDANERRAAWIPSDYLSWSYPGKTEYIGWGSSGYSYGDPEVQWSKDYFVGSRQKYTLLKSEFRNCDGFTLDYQVTARNGADTQQCLGPRSVYVNDGSGWTYVGSFDYDSLGPVHVVVRLDSPMTLAAVATTASCAKPDTFLFRQSVIDVQ